MDALKLDVEAIRKRVLEQAVVVFGGSRHGIDIALNAAGRYWLVGRDTHISIELLGDGSFFDHIILPGDEAEFSDDGKNWRMVGLLEPGLFGFIEPDVGEKEIALPALDEEEEE